ncbi:hypothetical protein [Streptosporangium sp. NPDC000396]|uniref:hypothetical protein n=1 Tax=Streptosporangium sp. NPDC000396 TaxID=3366185 RepID=UPI00367B88FE
MKRYVAGLACAAAAVLSAPALASTAHAQTADPVTVLKSQFGNGRGVTFVDKTKIQSKGESAIVADRKGTLHFGASGIAASDQTGKLRLPKGMFPSDSDEEDEESKGWAGLGKPERVIRVKQGAFISGGFLGEYIPADKTWVKSPGDSLGLVGALSQKVNVAEPATLGALLAHATTKRPGFYAGKITYGELRKISPWFRASTSLLGESSGEDKGTITWKLYLNAGQLPERLVTSEVEASSERDKTATIVDTRYSGWGSKVTTIKAPAPEEIATFDELDKGAKDEVPIPLGK